MENKKYLIESLLVGSDQEFFLQDKNTNEIVSAEGLIKGTKDEPFKFMGEDSFFATSLDNVLYEGNIPPAKTAAEFVEYFNTLRSYMESTIPDTLRTLAKGSARLDHKWLQTDHARTYGCAISHNAWTEEAEFIQPKKRSNLRAAGLHLHAGYKNPDYDTNILYIRAMDLMAGIPSVIMEPFDERKKVGYGKAGNHRHCSYGVEYRSLSSYFASTPELLTWAFNTCHSAAKFINDGRIEEINSRGDEIQSTINKNNKKAAERLIKEFNLQVN